jgi:hypothetical protein
MKIEFHYLHHRDHFLRQLFLKKRNHNLISGKDDVTYFVLTDDLSQALDDLFGVLLVRVPSIESTPGYRRTPGASRSRLGRTAAVRTGNRTPVANRWSLEASTTSRRRSRRRFSAV